MFRLTAEQRINLTVLLGSLECSTISETKAIWQLIDSIELNTMEKAQIDFQSKVMNGAEAFMWSKDKPLEPKECDFSDSDIKRIRKALEACPRFIPQQARTWLEPLLAQLPEEEERTAPAPALVAGAGRR